MLDRFLQMRPCIKRLTWAKNQAENRSVSRAGLAAGSGRLSNGLAGEKHNRRRSAEQAEKLEGLRRVEVFRWPSTNEARNVVLGDVGVAGNQCQGLGLGLSDQNPVDGVPMVHG